jgi:ribosomal protein S18 acetylase RimI-like enzyme
MKSFVFQPANETDLEFLSRLAAEVFSKYGKYDEIVPYWFLQRRIITEIILEGSDPLGYAMLELGRQKLFEPRRAHLLAIAVCPEHQRKGVGSALLNHMEEIARKYGVGEMHLWTAQDNSPAISFFRGAGFGIIGSEDCYYPQGQPALAMSKKLVP